MKRKGMKVLLAIALVTTLFLAASEVKAAGSKEVTITTSDYKAGVTIQEALDLQKQGAYDQLTVTLSPGEYHITSSFTLYSHTKLIANGCTIYYERQGASQTEGTAPLFLNECVQKKGYTGASDIAIEGGTWDFQGSKGQINYTSSMEAVRLMHGQNFTLTNMTFTNLSLSHYVTIEGVKNVTISGCTFTNMTNRTARKEAIHIDCMHNENMAPSTQDVYYDDTICQDITVSGCTFDGVPRGVGTHIAVAGLYPSGITITNNQFRNITYEAVKAYHYKNAAITGNVISNAGCGIKYYLFAEEADNDHDEEGDSNYLPALKGTATEALPANLNTVIADNTISDTQSKDNGFGIQVAGCAGREAKGVTVQNNTITTTKLAGIYLKYADQSSVLSNTVTAGGETGILVADCDQASVASNQVKQAKANGLIAQDSTKIALSDNMIIAPKLHGIYVKNVPGVTILKNQMQNTPSGGICVDQGCAKAAVTSNRIGASQKFGIYVNKNASVRLTGNMINSTKKDAIDLMQCKKAVVSKNKINKAGNIGIFANKSDYVTLKKNTVTASKNSGVVLQDLTNGKAAGNMVKQAGKFGILFNKVKKSSGSGNRVINAKNYAINYSSNSKQVKWNLKFVNVTAKKGKSEVTGSTAKGVKASVKIGTKTYAKSTKPNGAFTIKTKKLKKGERISVVLKDKLGNTAEKNIKVK
ncbi:MAG: right-handed parallel beta-helix repeat-containing protein [Lachnospiraceae bacterium]|nr:right-handed parallel beta-helix repeat-containing protein [Lachnospiraceae bacterium]